MSSKRGTGNSPLFLQIGRYCGPCLLVLQKQKHALDLVFDSGLCGNQPVPQPRLEVNA
jgi:hypothetical protein